MEKGLLPALLASVSLKGYGGKRESLRETSGQFKAADFSREVRGQNELEVQGEIWLGPNWSPSCARKLVLCQDP